MTNERIIYPDGSRLYRIVRPKGSTGRMGVSLRTCPGESRHTIAARLRRARKMIRGLT